MENHLLNGNKLHTMQVSKLAPTANVLVNLWDLHTNAAFVVETGLFSTKAWKMVTVLLYREKVVTDIARNAQTIKA